jgi:hypothetical protein
LVAASFRIALFEQLGRLAPDSHDHRILPRNEQIVFANEPSLRQQAHRKTASPAMDFDRSIFRQRGIVR